MHLKLCLIKPTNTQAIFQLIMPGYCVAGTVGHKVLNGVKRIEMENKTHVSPFCICINMIMYVLCAVLKIFFVELEIFYKFMVMLIYKHINNIITFFIRMLFVCYRSLNLKTKN